MARPHLFFINSIIFKLYVDVVLALNACNY